MSCTINSGFAKGCRDNIAGIQKVYISNFNENVTYTLGTNSVVEGYTVSSGATPSFYTFEQELETAEFNETITASTENGTVFYEQTLTLTFHKVTAELKALIKLLTQADLLVMPLDQRGVYHLMGAQNGVRVSEGTIGVGKAFGDLNGATLTFVSKEPSPAYVVDQTSTAFDINAN